MSNKRITPDIIETLLENEIFVFGSNMKGVHGGGAARFAYNKFGAVWGGFEGQFGESYALPTMNTHLDPLELDEILFHVDRFIDFAKKHPEKNYLVTAIGCGICGYTPHEIAPLFRRALEVENIALPQLFINILTA